MAQECCLRSLIGLCGDPDSFEARMRLLETMDKYALVREIHRCLDIGLSRQVLARVASIALDDYARRMPVYATAAQGHFTVVQGKSSREQSIDVVLIHVVPVDPERQRPAALTFTNPAASNPTRHNKKKRKTAHGDWDSERTEARAARPPAGRRHRSRIRSGEGEACQDFGSDQK